MQNIFSMNFTIIFHKRKFLGGFIRLIKVYYSDNKLKQCVNKLIRAIPT